MSQVKLALEQCSIHTVLVELTLDLSVVLELEMVFSDGNRTNFAVAS